MCCCHLKEGLLSVQLVDSRVTVPTFVHKPSYGIGRHGNYPKVCLEGSSGTEGHFTFKLGSAAMDGVDAFVIKIRFR